MSHPEPTADLEADLDQLDRRPARGFVLRVPPDSSSVAIVRSAIRRTIRFGSEDLESQYLSAATEILINAIEEHQRRSDPDDVIVTVALTDEPGMTVSNRSDVARGAWSESLDNTEGMSNQRGRGLLIASTLVPGIEISVHASTVVATLPLRGFGTVA